MSKSDPRFDAAKFRSAIQFAMQMGTPAQSSQRTKFVWSGSKMYSSGADQNQNPFDWSSAPAIEQPERSLEVLCAIEYSDAGGAYKTGVGSFEGSTIVATLLDEEYTKLLTFGDGRRPDLALVNGATFEIQYELPPVGLFDVTVHSLFLRAKDEF